MNPTDSPARVPHPVYGDNWDWGDDYGTPAGLRRDDPKWGDLPDLTAAMPCGIDAAVEAEAPALGLTYDGLRNAAVNEYLRVVEGIDYGEWEGRCCAWYLARLGRPVPQ